MITAVSIQVALTPSDKPETFNFSRVRIITSLVLKLSTGRLSLKNFSFVVADADNSCEDVPVGHSVLRHQGIDSRNLLERYRAVLEGPECSSVGHPSV